MGRESNLHKNKNPNGMGLLISKLDDRKFLLSSIEENQVMSNPSPQKNH